MPYKRQSPRAQYSEGSKKKYRKSDDDDNDSEKGEGSTEGITTLIHDFVNKR
jgi:hypothetical protein